MKQVLLLLLLIIPKLLNAQSFENLDVGKFFDPTQWNGDNEAFEITADNALRSKTITTTYLSSKSSLAYHSVWEFGIQLDFDPSVQNQLRVYLISNKDSLKKPLNGYFIQLGESGDTDRYHLYKQNEDHISLVMSSPPKPRENPIMVKSRVKVTRDSLGQWNLYTAQNDEDFVLDASATDNEFRSSTHFGIHCQFTSGNSNKFQFDYFRIDTLSNEDFTDEPEVVDSFEKLKPSFTEDLLLIDTFENNLSLWTGQKEKFMIKEKVLLHSEGANTPSFIHVPNTETKNRLWEIGLEVNGSLTSQNYARLYLTATNDSLPGNQQGYHLQIDGSGGNHTYKLYKQNNATRSLLWQSMPFPTLENKLRARVRITCTIDGEWKVYSDEYDQGEFTLLSDEDRISSIVDLSHSSSLYSGWMTRFSSTRIQDYTLHYFLIKELEDIPIVLDESPPYIVTSTVLDSISIKLTFNEALNILSANALENYRLNLGYGSPIKSVTEGSMVTLSFADSLLTSDYALSVKNMADTVGNIMVDTLISFQYKAPEPVEPETPWRKLEPDDFEEFLAFDAFENGLDIWKGEAEKFQIENQVLMNVDTAKSPSFLHLPNTEIKNRIWEVGMEINGLFTTQNNVRIYLTAIQDSLPGNQKGYYLQIDGSGGNHTYKLYKQNNATRSLLWQSMPFPTQENKLRARVRVTCTIDGEWRVYVDEYDQGKFTLLSGQDGTSSIVDLSHSTSIYSGWMTRFSSTRVQDYALHYFLIKELEDIPPPVEDKSPPYVVSSSVLDSISIGLTFDKEPDTLSANTLENYWLSPDYGSPIKSVTEGSTIIISFADSLLTDDYELGVKNITDTSGNIMVDTLISFQYKAPEAVEPETPWRKLEPDDFEELFAFDAFENGLDLWSGEIEKFQIKNQVLINADTAKSPSFLHLPNTETRNRLWEVGLEINGLLSTQNNVRIYLTATQDSLPGNQKGYHLQIDGSGGKHIYKLYKQNTGKPLWQSVPFPTKDNKLRTRVRVTCTIDGEWKVYADEYDQGEFVLLSNEDGVSSFMDLSYSTSLYSGWMTRFSSTRIQDYTLHYFLIKELENIPPPVEEGPSYVAKAYDVIINEIMADPKNAIDLPNIEYVELKNLSDEEINLNGWTYSSRSTTYQFVKGKIPPSSFLVLYKENDSLLIKGFGESIGLFSWPPLVNAGTTLTLENEEGLIIDQVDYKTIWYGNTQKSKGGWSLERIDPYLRCEDDENWRASIDPSGGTPGRENSIHEIKPSQPLMIVNLDFTGSNQLSVSFNKKIKHETISLKTAYHVNNGMGVPDSVEIIDHRNVVLFYSNDFLKGYHYALKIEGLADCMGNKENISGEIFLAESIDPNDILINEVLADPFKDGVEFVEIYNNSQKTLDLNTLFIGTIRESDGAILSKSIIDEPHLITPSSYRLLSSNSKIVSSQYPNAMQENFIQMPSFPQLRNSHGTIVLVSGENLIDLFDYHENMHDALITNKKGVSLERIRFNSPTNEPGNFKSAAATEGYATPGYKNSQLREESQESTQISLHSKTFSPDHDGFEDLLEINYSLQEEDIMVNIEIYNNRGLLIRTLHKNHRLASKGSLYWDGLMDNNQLANVGIYIVVMELYNSKGMRKIVRETCVLARKL